MTDHLKFGLQIEDQACHWFTKTRNARLIARNYRCRVGEIDLIFEEPTKNGDKELVFVEVRARLARRWVSGVESVDWKKRIKLSRTIEHFLVRYRGTASSLRVDLLGWNGESWEHLRDARILDLD